MNKLEERKRHSMPGRCGEDGQASEEEEEQEGKTRLNRTTRRRQGKLELLLEKMAPNPLLDSTSTRDVKQIMDTSSKTATSNMGLGFSLSSALVSLFTLFLIIFIIYRVYNMAKPYLHMAEEMCLHHAWVLQEEQDIDEEEASESARQKV